MTTLIPKFEQTGATINRPINLKLAEFVTPEDFGALGNGTTDDSAAIQAALDTGKTVFGACGSNYKITSGVTISEGQLVDFNKATLTPVGTFNAITLSSDQFTLQNLYINAVGLTGASIYAPSEVQTFFINNVDINGGTDGIILKSVFSSYITNCRMAYTTNSCFQLLQGSVGQVNSLWITGCSFVNSGTSGKPVVYVYTSGGIHFDKCNWQGNNAGTYGIQIAGTNGCYITNSYVEEYGTTAWVWLNNATTANLIQYVYIQNNYALMDGIEVLFGLHTASNVVITDNTFIPTGASTGAAIQGLTTGMLPEVHSNYGARLDIDDSFIPSLFFGTSGSTGITYTTRTGQMRNLGQYIEGGFAIVLSNKGSSTGSAQITIPTNMLISVPNQTITASAVVNNYENMTSITSVIASVDNSSIRLKYYASTLALPIDDTNFTNTTTLFVSFKSPYVNIYN